MALCIFFSAMMVVFIQVAQIIYHEELNNIKMEKVLNNYISVPTYDNGTWTVTDFSTREDFRDFLLPLLMNGQVRVEVVGGQRSLVVSHQSLA